MAPGAPGVELPDLIGRIHAGDRDGSAWRGLRAHFKEHVRACVHEGVGAIEEGERKLRLNLAREVERQFWHQLSLTRTSLPKDPGALTSELGGRALAAARHAAGEYRSFDHKLAECAPDVRPILADWLPSAPVSLVEELAAQAWKHLWHIRHELGDDCGTWWTKAAAFAGQTAEIASLLLRWEDRETLDRLFTILRELLDEMGGRRKKALNFAAPSTTVPFAAPLGIPKRILITLR